MKIEAPWSKLLRSTLIETFKRHQTFGGSMTRDELAYLQKLIRLTEQHSSSIADCIGIVRLDVPNRQIYVGDSSWSFDAFMSLNQKDL